MQLIFYVKAGFILEGAYIVANPTVNARAYEDRCKCFWMELNF